MKISHRSSTPEAAYLKQYLKVSLDNTDITTAGGWVIVNNGCDKLASIFSNTALRFIDNDKELSDWSEPMLEFISELHVLMKRHLKLPPVFEMRFVKLNGLPYICFTYDILKANANLHAFYLKQITLDSYRSWMECFNYWLSGREQRFLGKFFGRGKIISEIRCSYYNNAVLCHWKKFLFDINYTTPEEPFLRLTSTLIIPTCKTVYRRVFFTTRRFLGRVFLNMGFYPQWVIM